MEIFGNNKIFALIKISKIALVLNIFVYVAQWGGAYYVFSGPAHAYVWFIGRRYA